jgi:hypothetical protein
MVLMDFGVSRGLRAAMLSRISGIQGFSVIVYGNVV